MLFVDGIGMGWMVIKGHRSSKSTFSGNKSFYWPKKSAKWVFWTFFLKNDKESLGLFLDNDKECLGLFQCVENDMMI